MHLGGGIVHHQCEGDLWQMLLQAPIRGFSPLQGPARRTMDGLCAQYRTRCLRVMRGTVVGRELAAW